MMEGVLTTKQVAARLEVTEGWVRMLLLSGQLEGSKHGKSWAVTEAAVERYRMERNFSGDRRRNGAE